jgi:hypothetical protein
VNVPIKAYTSNQLKDMEWDQQMMKMETLGWSVKKLGTNQSREEEA